MKARQPGQKEEKDHVSTDHLGFFGSGKDRPESDPHGGRRDIDPQEIEQPDEKGSGDKEKPERKRNLLRGQKGKSDKAGKM